jgi:hypothetical protein
MTGSLDNFNSIHQNLRSLVMQQAEQCQDPALRKFLQKDLKWHELFGSYRKNNNQSEIGLKLTVKGLRVFSLLWQSYTVSTLEPVDQIPLVLLWLDRTQILPYYLDKKSVVFFDEDAAVIAKLNSGDLLRLAKQWHSDDTPTIATFMKSGR